MTDIDTGTGLFPTAAQAATALSILKSSTSDSVARPWWLVGDGGIFYFGSAWSALNSSLFSGYSFGDANSLRAADAYSALLIADQAGVDTLPGYTGAANSFTTLGAYNATQAGKYFARPYTQVGSSVAAGMMGDSAFSSVIGSGGLAYPHPPDNGLLFAPVGVVESSCVRSRALPGLYQPLHNAPLTHLDTVTGLPDFPGRTFQTFGLANGASAAQCLIDITGPWR